MAMSPRILILSATGIALYLGLSLYHDHQLKKYPDLKTGTGKALSTRAEEKTWVQVSTTKQVTPGPVQPQEAKKQPAGGTGKATVEHPGGQVRPAAAEDQLQSTEPASIPEDPREVLSALQAELRQSRTLLQTREEELRQTRRQLNRVREDQQQTIEISRKWRDELAPIQSEQERQLAEIERLQTELKEARARAAVAEGELERARLKAEAMFRYGQEQSRLLAPARQEVEVIRTRLEETRNKLRQTEQLVTDLKRREQQLRKEQDGLRSASQETSAAAAPTSRGKETTPAAERAD